MISYVPVTIVDGTTYTGLYAADGSYNIVDRTSDTAEWLGVMHPCGALNVVAVDGSTYVGLYAENGALNAIEGTVPGQLLHPSGALQINQGIGTLTLSADTAYYTLTYPATNLFAPFTASNPSYTYTPQDVSFRVDRVLIADNPSYTYSPQDIGVSRDYTLAAEYAAYTYTAQDAALLALGLFEHATYTYTPQDVTFLYDRVLAADNAAYTYSPQDVNLPLGLLYEHASYTFSPQDVTMTRSYHLAAANASYTLSPQAATLTYTAGGPDYTENSFDPPVVADFAGVNNSGTEYYRVGGSETTFDSMFTFSRAGNATMVDSDGLLKWAPHNLLTKPSEDFTTYTTSGSPVVTHNTGITGPTGTGITASTTIEDDSAAAYEFITGSNTTPTGGVTYTLSWFLKKSAQTNYMEFQAQMFDTTHTAILCVRPSDGAFNVREGTSDSSSVTSWDSNWWLCELTVTPTSGDTGGFRIFPAASTDGTNGTISASLTGTIEVTGVHFYRSDLGGMVDNPDTASSYVPVPSTSNVFLARRNHYRYNGSTYDNKGILLESAARTNVFTQSQNFANAVWTTFPSNLGTTVLNAVGPDGVANSAATLVDDSGGGTGEVYMNGPSGLTVSTSTTYTFSIFAKASGVSHMAIYTRNFTTPGDVQTWFNLSTGAVGTTGTGHTARIENCGNGWYRCILTFTTDASDTTGTFRIYPCEADNDLTVDRDGTSSILIYGAQFEAGATPSSYIPTSGATATRAAETLTIAAANMSGHAGDVSIHHQGEVFAKMSTTNTFLGIWGGTTLYISPTNLIRTSAVGVIRSIFRNGGTFIADEPPGTARNVAELEHVGINVALRYDYGTELEYARDGSATATPTASASLVDTTSLDYHFHEAGQTNMSQTIALFRQWDADIGDTGIESATS